MSTTLTTATSTPETASSASAGGPFTGTWTIMRRELLPNATSVLLVEFALRAGYAPVLIGSLGFLGFGLPPGTPSWGELLSQGQEFPFAWWLILYPAVALFVVVLLGVFVGEGARNAFDPRSRSKLQ